mmetsp:Transcript_30464/g.59261  ORF Transcript_30464/g.59261 Transcript_30464/m.59261 type:complete len:326 (+) Transcript_30464:50-1027(+)
MSSPPSFSPNGEEPLEESTPSAVTPLLSQTPRGDQTKPDVDDVSLQFYDPSAMLTLSRDVAFAYLILLTGGNLDLAEESLKAERDCYHDSHNDIGYVAPSIRRNGQSAQPPENDAQREISASSPTKTAMDESTASLAYAAIVDGNVLPACFGLKTLGNGRVLPAGHPPFSSGNALSTASSSLWDRLCCLPKSQSPSSCSSSSSSRHIMTNLPLPSSPRRQSKNSTEMQRTVECLRDIRDRHCQNLSRSHCPASSSSTVTATEDATTSMYMQVVYAYIHCFAAIVQYHDQLQHHQQEQKQKQQQQQQQREKQTVFERHESKQTNRH